LDRLKKFQLVKLEVWIDIGLAKHKIGDPLYLKNKKIKEEISDAI